MAVRVLKVQPGWSRDQVVSVATTLNDTESLESFAAILRLTLSQPSDFLPLLHVLDACMKQSPKFIPVIREACANTALPAVCGALIAHWIDLRFLEVPHVPKSDYGYFFWKKVYRDMEEQSASIAATVPVQATVIHARMGAVCVHCHDTFAQEFDDGANAWVYACAVERDGTLLHVDCADVYDYGCILDN